MLIHISCIRTLSFLSICFVCDVFPLSLSLSFSLSDRLHMAPKHKSTPAQNPLNSESFSSDLTPPLHVRFHDGKVEQDFLENFQRRGVHPKRHVILSDFSNTPLSDVIWIRG